MTQKTLYSIILTMILSLYSYVVLANGHTTKTATEQTSKEAKTTSATDHSDAAKKMPVSATDSHSKVPHGKTHVPHMEELPHIHRFHKERVKKIKKHHSKLWFLSQALIVLCHISILVIGFLHATH
jgi:hypothetical protein